ncbi:energy-coupling factor transporter transmembrane protein EcfT [Terrilactibacillus sp. BCM23-1]|uniref:Energy-coupling factor transporter transmembrane protein EcfT n=1 Tax=Terrilactibacillus tamarindi TaxID=2599694 RepID=A0A6N8CR14_9BACI|nr:energy-coupling factor transporter transmembrane component T [Terrilactibacillus tamarindi]MTT32604.1 energy-coupling factor transporter transmembrane protein EcfT [Terrilactibacillus tamarindi]
MNTYWNPNQKWLARVNPSLKFLTIAAIFMIYLFVHNFNVMLVSSFAFFIFYLFCNGFSKKLSFWLVAMTFILSVFSASAMVFFGKGTHMLFEWHLITISIESMTRGLHLGLRTFVYGMLGLIFASTTEPVPFFYSVMQQLRIPPKYAYSFLAAFRLIPIMIEEYRIIRAAMKVRGMSEEKGLRAFYRRMKRYAIILLAQAIRRAQRIAVAMEAKQFSMVKKRTYYYQIGFSRYDVLFTCLILLIIIGSWIFSSYVPLTPYNNVLERSY